VLTERWHVARLSTIGRGRADGAERMAELVGLLQDHRDAGSEAAARLLDAGDIGDGFWVVEPVVAATAVAVEPEPIEATAVHDRLLQVCLR
jgi:hypothetical protein